MFVTFFSLNENGESIHKEATRNCDSLTQAMHYGKEIFDDSTEIHQVVAIEMNGCESQKMEGAFLIDVNLNFLFIIKREEDQQEEPKPTSGMEDFCLTVTEELKRTNSRLAHLEDVVRGSYG